MQGEAARKTKSEPALFRIADNTEQIANWRVVQISSLAMRYIDFSLSTKDTLNHNR